MIKSFTKPAIKINEDTFIANEDYIIVLDGATGLLKENITDKPSDANWFVLEFKDYLASILPQKDKTLKELVANAIGFVDNKYMSLPGAENVKSKPSAGLSLVRVNNNKLEYLLLGDCSLIVEKTDGSFQTLQMQELVVLDGGNIEKLVEVAKSKNINVVDARPHINDDLLRVRLMQNKPGGYYVLGDVSIAAEKALSGSIDLDEIKSICLLTDGYSQVYDTFSLYEGPEGLIADLEHKTPEEIYEVLWQNQEEDKFCNEKPRFKLRDDATVVYKKFK